MRPFSGRARADNISAGSRNLPASTPAAGKEDAIQDILFALGLVLAFEGLLCAAFPSAMRKAMYEASQLPESPMRIVGVVSAAVGILLLWLIKAV